MIPTAIRERHQFRPGDELWIEEQGDKVVLKKARRQRKELFLQWMLNCPAADFKIERLRDLPNSLML